jgi:hypothetical protein
MNGMTRNAGVEGVNKDKAIDDGDGFNQIVA